MLFQQESDLFGIDCFVKVSPYLHGAFSVSTIMNVLANLNPFLTFDFGLSVMLYVLAVSVTFY